MEKRYITIDEIEKLTNKKEKLTGLQYVMLTIAFIFLVPVVIGGIIASVLLALYMLLVLVLILPIHLLNDHLEKDNNEKNI